ncbi:MAG: hypothetical protein ACRDJG_12405 [Actinomycetota bacterium]
MGTWETSDYPSLEELRAALIPTGDQDRWDRGELPHALFNLENQAALSGCEVLLSLAIVTRRSFDQTKESLAVALREILLELLPKELDHPFCSVLRALAGLEPGTAGRRREERQRIAGIALGSERHPATSRAVRRRVKEDCWAWLFDRLIEREVRERRASEVTPWTAQVSPLLSIPNLAALLGDLQPGGELAKLVLAADALALPQIPLEPDAEYVFLVKALVGWAYTMNRRDLLHKLSRAAAVAATAPAFHWVSPDELERVALAIQTPSRADGAVIAHIEEVLWGLRRQHDTLGPQAVFDTVLAQRTLVLAMQDEVSAGLRPRLLSVFSNLSDFAGWLSFNLNDFETARHYYEEARRAAHEARDNELAAHVLCNLSYLATWQGMARVGADHAVAAKGWAERTDNPLLRSYAADMAARAYALDGHPRACMEEIEAARSHLSAATISQTHSPLLRFYNEGFLAATESRCLLELGDPRQAGSAATRAVALTEGAFVLNRAMSTIYLGTALLREGDMDQAVKVIGDAADLTARHRSARLVERLRAARAEMQQWHATRAVKVKELDERLASYGLA